MSQGPTSQAQTTAPEAPSYRMRIKLWGVQGSCPVFPRPRDIAEYARQVAVQTLIRAWKDLSDRTAEGIDAVAQLAREPLDIDRIEAYQARIGLPVLPAYGGETTCLQVDTADGDVIFFDGGSGIRPAARDLALHWPENRPRVLHFFSSHEHLDHRSGLPFSQFCFAKPHPFTLHIHGTHGMLTALDERFGIYSREIRKFTHLDDPLDFRMMSAIFTGTELRNTDRHDWEDGSHNLWRVRNAADPVHVGRALITPFDVYHGSTRCLAYKVEYKGAKFVFCTDHELRHIDGQPDARQRDSEEAEARLRHHLQDADVAYLDGQYFRREYDGKVGIGVSPAIPRIDWGHSCIEDCLERAAQCRVKHCIIGHHDPERDWAEQIRIDRQLAEVSQAQGALVQLARADQVVDL